ncbi:MAG: PKD domain-containing protein [Nanoarchaeota archaeon]|nr:PKD domain-containing protein [Nanoarchaeota archaeon]
MNKSILFLFLVFNFLFILISPIAYAQFGTEGGGFSPDDPTPSTEGGGFSPPDDDDDDDTPSTIGEGFSPPPEDPVPPTEGEGFSPPTEEIPIQGPGFSPTNQPPEVISISVIPSKPSTLDFLTITVFAKDDKEVSKIELIPENVIKAVETKLTLACPSGNGGTCEVQFSPIPDLPHLGIWAPRNAGDQFSFTAVATDSDGEKSAEFKVGPFTVIRIDDDDDDEFEPSGPSGAPSPGAPSPDQPPVIINNPPTITSTPITSATEDILYTYDVDATDPNNDQLTFSLPQGPSGMTIGTSTGLIQWIPTNNQVGNILVTVKVRDPVGLSDTQQFTISVAAVNDAPTLSIPDQNVNEDAGFLDNLVDLFSFAFDEETSLVNLIFSIITQSNTNIVACSLDSNRFIDCRTKQDKNGFSDVTVRVQDDVSPSLSTDDTFRVNVGNVNDGPSVQIIKPQSTFLENEVFDFEAQATDIDFDALTYTIDFGDGTTETGTVGNNNLVTTKHSYPSQGIFTLTITVTDGVLSDTDTVIITIVPFTVKIITDKERDKFPQRVNFDVNLNGGKEPFTFEWDFTEDGITDSTLRKPTALFSEGTFTVLVRVTDSDGDISTDTVTLKVTKIESMPRKIAHINSIRFENEFVEAGDNLDIFINFENKGNFHIRDARLTAIIQDLGIRSRTVKAVVDKNKQASKFLTLEIPDYAQPGIYYVMIVIDLDGDRRIKFRPIEII